MKKTILTLIIVLALAVPVLVFAQTGLGAAGKNLSQAGKGAGVETNQQLQDVVGTAINAALTLVGIIFMILMIYAGYLWMTAREQEEMVDKAKKIITASIIGLVIVTSAYAITFFVTRRFEGTGGSTVPTGCCVIYENSVFKQCTNDASQDDCLAGGQISPYNTVFNEGKQCSDVVACTP